MSDINPGIQKTVALLNQYGFTTTDSGDGVTHDFECDRDVGYVTCIIEDHSLDMAAEARRLMNLLESHGLQFRESEDIGESPLIQITYNPRDGLWLLDVHDITDAMLNFGEN